MVANNHLGSMLLRTTNDNKILLVFGIVIMLFTCIECKTSTVQKHNIVLDFIYPMVDFMFLIFKPNPQFEVNILVICIGAQFNILELCNLLQDFKSVLQEMFQDKISFKNLSNNEKLEIYNICRLSLYYEQVLQVNITHYFPYQQH